MHEKPCLIPILISDNSRVRKSYFLSIFARSDLVYTITLRGHWGTTDDFTTIPFHQVLSSSALVELAKSTPVHSLTLSSHLFFCRPFLLSPFPVSSRIVFAKPEDLDKWPNQLSFRSLTKVRSYSCFPMAAWLFRQTSLLVTWSLFKLFSNLR